MKTFLLPFPLILASTFPCVEINLRRTMGHVAIAISPQDRLQPSKLMTIEHDVNYQLKVRRLEDY
jgi:hypothetical protein